MYVRGWGSPSLNFFKIQTCKTPLGFLDTKGECTFSTYVFIPQKKVKSVSDIMNMHVPNTQPPPVAYACDMVLRESSVLLGRALV